jgi:hypothetical protein
VRILPALALIVAACGDSDRPEPASSGGAAVVAGQSRDQLLLRVPRRGGAARVHAYPQLDSVVWTAPAATPVVARALAFDQEGGIFAFVDARNVPRFLDLRTGSIPAGVSPLKGITSRDALNVFGIATDGSVIRATPGAVTSTAWKYKAPARANAVFPQPDGSILVVGDRQKSLAIWHLFPPDRQVMDSATLPTSRQSVPIQVGDRLYLPVDSGLVGVRGRDLALVAPIELDNPAIALAPTPSGDRVFVASDSSSEIQIVDRYRDEIIGEIKLPGQPSELRMDPLGRYLLARPASGDSIWVVALGTGRLVGSARSSWRADLPIVTPDAGIALLIGREVTLIDAETLQRRSSVKTGGDDFWYFFEWSGFRPRAAGIDEPVTFDGIGVTDSTPLMDTTWADSLMRMPPVTPLLPPTGDSSNAPATRPPGITGFTVSFAALLDQRRAQEMASAIKVDGRTAHLVPAVREGVTVFRVVLGPYSSRADAEKAGKASGRQYWVYEGPP